MTPCRLASFTVPSNPGNLVITRSASPLSFLEFGYSPTYANIFSNSEPSNCPVLGLEFQDTSGVQMNNPSLTMSSLSTPASAKLRVRIDVPFTLSVRIKAFTMSKNAY